MAAESPCSSISGAPYLHSHWTDALSEHPIFGHLAEECCINSNEERIAVCQAHGDLFVWDPINQLILTTNLKRLHGNVTAVEEAIHESPFCFQYLHPIVLPATPPNSLLPSPTNTRYLALIGDHYLYIIELWRQRGPHGEFSGGVAEVDCRTIPIGDTIIRAHRLLVLQAEWHPEDSTVIGALFNDGGLRLFKLSNPAVPFMTLIVSNPHSTFSQLLRLHQSGVVISFSFATNKIILLQDTMDIQTIPIKDGEQPTVPLPMYPLDKDNYSDTACGMLVLQTHPPIIVMATTTGRLLHCILLEFQDDDENGISSEDGSVTVVETIELGINGKFIKFLYDPLMKYSYYVVTSLEVYSTELPWVQNLEQYGFDGVQFSTNPPSVDQVLHHSLEHCICDGTIISDPILGVCIIATSTNGNCIPIQINQQLCSLYQSSFLNQLPSDGGVNQPMNPFVMHICELLDTPKEKHQIQLKPDGGKSQKECFQFLQESLINIRQIYVAPQQTAAVKLIGRIQSLEKRRERHIGQVLAMEEECDTIRETGRDLELKIDCIRERHKDQNNRIERILSTITKSSPVLSDAEKMLAQDLMIIQEQMEPLKFTLSQAKEKVKLGLSKTKNTRLKLNADKLDTILTSLTNDGSAIQNNIKTIKKLAEVIDVDIMKQQDEN